MRVLKILLVSLLIALLAAGVYAWRLPADVAYRNGAKYLGPVVLTGLRGSVWDGHADGVSVLGRDLGEIDWRASKTSLLQRRFVADVRIKGTDVNLAGVLERGAGTIAARDLRFSVPMALLAPALDLGGLHAQGMLDGVIDQATFANARLGDVGGNARWTGGVVTGQAELHLPDILAEFKSQPDGGIAGSVRDDGHGDLAVDGTFALRFPILDAQLRLSARNGDAQVAEMLRGIGEPQADGSTQLVVRNQMLKPF